MGLRTKNFSGSVKAGAGVDVHDSSARSIVLLYTDGACLKNPGGPGGWAFVLHHPPSGRRKEQSGGDPQTTNNRMEILAVTMSERPWSDVTRPHGRDARDAV